VWDYHVILLALPGSITTTLVEKPTIEPTCLIFDLDSSMPSPSPLAAFIQHALVVKSSTLPEHYRRLFRVVSAAAYLDNFSSDRSHMLKKKGSSDGGGDFTKAATFIQINNKEYMSPPPQYPCITSTNGNTNTLPKYLEMPSYTQAVSNWKESPLENFIIKNNKAGGKGRVGVGALPYGVVLTEEAFLDFAAMVTNVP
jgi:N-terminal glutamine amidase